MTTPKKDRKLTFDLVFDRQSDEVGKYQFDVSFPEQMEHMDDFMAGMPAGEGEEGGEEDEEEEEESTKEKSEESLWDITTVLHSEESGKYGEEFHEGEELGEEEAPSSTISTIERSEEEVARPEGPDHTEIPEVSADREALIIKLKELVAEKSELKRRNRLLELWVYRNMKKTQQRMIPSDHTKTAEQMEELYKGVLRDYKMQMDDIQNQHNELTYELESYAERIAALKMEDEKIYQQFLNREREVSIGLVFAKTGKRITDKMMDTLIRRQMERRQVLAQDRHNYVFLQHCLEDLHVRLRIAETLGEGMTAMDYEALYVANVNYKDRLDERDRELEKLRIKIAKTVNGVAQYKEKEVCLVEDIEFEQGKLEKYRDANTKVRERLNYAHMTLNEIRDTLNEKKRQAGFLVAQQELIEMEKMMARRDDLRIKIGILQREIEMYEPAKRRPRRTRMSDVSYA